MSDAAAVPETTSGTAKRHRNHKMNHAFNFSNKVIFVTGAGTGIGRATAVTFARAGARVVAVGRTDSSLQETTRQIEAIGDEALAIRCDVTHTDEIKAAPSSLPPPPAIFSRTSGIASSMLTSGPCLFA